MKILAVLFVLAATSASAQTMFAPGAAVYPSPAPGFLGGLGQSSPVILPEQCVIATPTSGNAVILTPCPQVVQPVPPEPTHPIAPTPPPVVTPPIVCPGCPACPVCPVPTPQAVPQAAPRAAPKAVPKKLCPCP